MVINNSKYFILITKKKPVQYSVVVNLVNLILFTVNAIGMIKFYCFEYIA